MYIKPQRTSKQASEWQNVSDNSAGTNLCARGAEEEHNGYQHCLNPCIQIAMYTNPQRTSKQASGKTSATAVWAAAQWILKLFRGFIAWFLSDTKSLPVLLPEVQYHFWSPLPVQLLTSGITRSDVITSGVNRKWCLRDNFTLGKQLANSQGI